jgi:hypothetical protein
MQMTREDIQKLTFIPLILVSASSAERKEKEFSWKYIQGAGDDAECELQFGVLMR